MNTPSPAALPELLAKFRRLFVSINNDDDGEKYMTDSFDGIKLIDDYLAALAQPAKADGECKHLRMNGTVGVDGGTLNCAACGKDMYAPPKPDAERVGLQQERNMLPMGPNVRDALLFALWHHQGGSSAIGQPIRLMLGMSQHERMSDAQIEAAKAVVTNTPKARAVDGVGDGWWYDLASRHANREWNWSPGFLDSIKAVVMDAISTIGLNAPEGFLTVPVIPTREMIAAGEEIFAADGKKTSPESVYDAMVQTAALGGSEGAL